MRGIMDKKNNIRNICVIGNIDHGKSTLTNSLVKAAGITLPKVAGKTHTTDPLQDEQECSITLKSVAISLHFELSEDKVPPGSDGNSFLVNLIDTPGHLDFSSEVSTALRVTDGALVVVDCVEGVCAPTETVLRQAQNERLKPVLFLTKIDRVLLELKVDQESAYQIFSRTIEIANVASSAYEDELLGDVHVNPSKGSVAFGSGLHGWGFTLKRFADMYSKKFGVDRERMMRKLWGDNYFDPVTKLWLEAPFGENGAPLKRAFCQFILDPIYRLFESILENQKDKYEKMLGSMNIVLQGEERNLEGQTLLKTVMKRFLPIEDALLEMIVTHLPSPVKAQRYRVENLYEGPMDDESANSIRECNPKGPLMIYISKMVPNKDSGHFYAFGRVFSGTVRPGQKVRILGPDFQPGKKDDVFMDKVLQTVLLMGSHVEVMDDVPCGNIVGLLGIDQYLSKCGTITDSELAHNIRIMRFSESPVIRVAVEPRNQADLPKLIEGLKRLSQSDPAVKSFTEDTGEHFVAGVGELHLEVSLKDLKDDYCGGIEIVTSTPIVSFRESVLGPSSQICLAKTPNKHHRLYMSAEPLSKGLAEAIEEGIILPQDSEDIRVGAREATFGWDPLEVRKIWSFGPDEKGPNLLVDLSKGVSYLDVIQGAVISGFNSVTRQGPLCEESLRNVRFNLNDAVINTDIRRGAGQFIPTARRCCQAAILTAQPCLLEPMYLVDITVHEDYLSGVYGVLVRRRGVVLSEETRVGNPINLLKVIAYLPVTESLGFAADLRNHTSGQAYSQCIFDHWQAISGDPYLQGTRANEVVTGLRKRKGLPNTLPSLDHFLDKL